MGSIRSLLGAVLAVFSAIAVAETPYEINSLHVGLVFTEAVARAEVLGGTCEITTARRSNRGKIAQCEYLTCAEDSELGACEQRDKDSSGFAIASQPVMHISLEAAGNDALVTRILIAYVGNTAAVEESLRGQFGEAIHDESAGKVKSWSNSHRLHWQRGEYRMGLLHPSQLIMLTVDLQSEDSAASD